MEQHSNSTNLVSVIIPTYNRESFLNEAIQSVINQSYRPIECIVIDDGSTDNTKNVVSELIKKNNDLFNLKYISQENGGSQVARNNGTSASLGEFIQYLDSDDILYPDKIEKQVSFLNENKNCDGVWGGWAKGTVEKNDLIESFSSEDLLTQFLTTHCIVNFSFLMKRELVQKIGDWDVNIKRNQEIDFQVRGLLLGANYQLQPQICGLWRIHDGDRIANTTNINDFLDFFTSWESILLKLDLFNNKMRKNIANTYLWLANINKENKFGCLILIMEAVRLNPDVHIMKTPKMIILRKIFGLRRSLKLWIWWSGKNNN